MSGVRGVSGVRGFGARVRGETSGVVARGEEWETEDETFLGDAAVEGGWKGGAWPFGEETGEGREGEDMERWERSGRGVLVIKVVDLLGVVGGGV